MSTKANKKIKRYSVYEIVASLADFYSKLVFNSR